VTSDSHDRLANPTAAIVRTLLGRRRAPDDIALLAVRRAPDQ